MAYNKVYNINMSNNLDKNLLCNLESLGLSEKEALVYVDLLKKTRPVGSSKIVTSTGLHGQYVYNALYALEEKGLAKHSIVNGRKKFEANPPARITNLIEEKRLVAQKTVEQLKTIAIRPIGQEFEVYQGETAYIQRQFDTLEIMPEGGEMVIISSDWVELFTEKRPDFVDAYEKRRNEKKITIRFILSEGLRQMAQRSDETRVGTEYRFLPEHQSYGGICVFNDAVDFFLMGDPITVFSFKNTKTTQGYRNFFEVLWQMAKE